MISLQTNTLETVCPNWKINDQNPKRNTSFYPKQVELN